MKHGIVWFLVSVALAGGTCVSCKSKGPAPEGAASVTAEPATAKPTASAEAKKPPTLTKPQDIPAPEDVAAPPKDAEKSESGLAWKVLKPGEGGDKPTKADKVKVQYTGWTKDGKMFDTSQRRGPATFGVGQVIPGWTEGLGLMTKGEKRRFWIPADLAYGETPKRPGAPAGQLTFDVELLEIVAAPKTPEDVAAPPKDAKKTKSGLSYKVLEKGKGDKHPGPTSRVTVHYSGWTTDGKMFDSSVMRGRPSTFALNQVIPGWTEGVQLMVEGEKARFWIPEDLAYKGRPGPQGMLVFDIELQKIY